jgi:hypothetical protein
VANAGDRVCDLWLGACAGSGHWGCSGRCMSWRRDEGLAGGFRRRRRGRHGRGEFPPSWTWKRIETHGRPAGWKAHAGVTAGRCGLWWPARSLGDWMLLVNAGSASPRRWLRGPASACAGPSGMRRYGPLRAGREPGWISPRRRPRCTDLVLALSHRSHTVRNVRRK